MTDKTHLTVLWTSDNPVTAEKMVLMYTVNALAHGWWEAVTLIVWGASVNLVCDNPRIQEQVRAAQAAGVDVSACKACADQLGAAERLKQLGIEVKYWGAPLTEVLKTEGALLTL
ncbi:MAG: DsrE family protein [Desulfobacterales bacterium]